MSKVLVQIESRVCDLKPCEGEAIGTCDRCRVDGEAKGETRGRDFCPGHGVVFQIQTLRPKVENSDKPDAELPPLKERTTWERVGAEERQLCFICWNQVKKLLAGGGA